MTHFIISEGSPTAWGGRTVRLEFARRKPELPTPLQSMKAARNRRIQAEYLKGKTGDVLAHQFGLTVNAIYLILHGMNTPMRPSGRRARS